MLFAHSICFIHLYHLSRDGEASLSCLVPLEQRGVVASRCSSSKKVISHLPSDYHDLLSWAHHVRNICLCLLTMLDSSEKKNKPKGAAGGHSQVVRGNTALTIQLSLIITLGSYITHQCMYVCMHVEYRTTTKG